MAKCPRCGSLRFRYELRSAGSSAKSRYYSTGFGSNLLVPAGLKHRKSQIRHKSVGICPDCGHIEEKGSKGCMSYVSFFLLCFLAFVIINALAIKGEDPAHVTEQNGAPTTTTATDYRADENLTPDYYDAESFEAALNAGEDVTGKTVQFAVLAFSPDSPFGYNMQAGEHLNFCSDSDPAVTAGDAVTLRVTKVSVMLRSYIVWYDSGSILVKKD